MKSYGRTRSKRGSAGRNRAQCFSRSAAPSRPRAHKKRTARRLWPEEIVTQFPSGSNKDSSPNRIIRSGQDSLMVRMYLSCVRIQIRRPWR